MAATYMNLSAMNLSADEMNSLRSNWRWSLAAGILVGLIGVVAIIHSVAATFVSLVTLAWLMIFAGITLAVHGFRNHKWSGFLLDLFGAAVIIATAILLVRSPLTSVLAVTVVLALYFIVSGIAETIGGFAGRYRSTGWAVFDGVISILLGAALLATWPTSGIWFLGFAVGVKLLFLGGGLVGLAMAARSLPKEGGASGEVSRAA